ncbi:MAG: TrbI/VirB10 family protein [Acidobacteriota bacterium]
MTTPKALVVAIGSTAFLAAAGAGGYLAVRSNPTLKADQVAESNAGTLPSAPAAAMSTTVDVPPPPAQPAEVARPEPRDRATRETPKAAPARPRPRPEAANRPVASPPASAPASVPSQPLPPPVADPAPVPVTEPPPPAKEPEKPKYEEVVVRADSVMGIRLDNAISSETARVEDRVSARVSRDVTVDDRLAIPAGSRLEGNVTLVERGGKFKERARLGIRFTSLVLADGTRIKLDTDTIYRDGDSPTGEATSKIGASTAVGAIIGAVIGGKKGAVIGSTTGAAGGTAAVMAGGRNAATIAAGTPLTVKLTSPVTVMVERQNR